MINSESTFKIRFMNMDEIARVTKLALDLQTYQKMKSIPRLPKVQDFEQELIHRRGDGRLIPNNHGTFTVVAIDETKKNVVDHDDVVGYLIYSFAFSTAIGKYFYINSFFIQEEYRRHGLGKKMMSFLKLHSTKLNIKWVDVCVMNNNLIGQKFYGGYGASVVNEEYQLFGKWINEFETEQ